MSWLLALLLVAPLYAQVDFRKETIYFLLPTRFFDGDPGNNRPNEWCSYYPGNPHNANFSGQEDVTWRGDFKGLIEKLDYIKDLGFTAIWITPVVQNRGPLDYHGYHAWDFMKVDPRLESPGATFKDVVDAAHAKGLKIVLDIVTNHSGRFGIKGQAELKYNTDTTKPWGKNLQGTALKDNPNWEYDGLNPNPDDGKLWSRANLAKMPAPFNQNLAAWNWPGTEAFVTTSDPNWFHHSGNGFAQGWDDTTNLYLRALADDCPDLNTSSPAVQDYLFNAYKKFLDAGVDAFRWDTWKHMGKQDIFALYDRFKAYKPDLFVFGEVAQKRHELHPVEEINPHWYTWRGGVGSSAPAGVGVVDFYAMSTFHGVFQNGGGFGGVTAAARYDHLYGDPSLLVTFLDNHDFGPNNDWNQRYGGSDENLAACMNFMFTWRGIPSLYYGTESRFKAGAYTDLHNAGGIQRSINETGRAYFGDAMQAAPNHKVYQHIKKLNAIRKAIPALQYGSWRWAGNAPGNAVGYIREAGSSYVCVGLAKDGGASFTFNAVPNGIYRDAVTGREVTVTNGNLSFAVTSTSAGIYVKDGPGMIGESGAGFFEPCVQGCTPPVKLSIAPTSSNYTAPVTVSMASQGGQGAIQIYYTLDGSTPTTASTLYTAPFTVSQPTVVKAIAIDAAGKQSNLEAQRYTFELPPPVLSITPASGNYFNPINVNMQASSGVGPYTIYYTTNGTEPTDQALVYNGAFAVSNATDIKAAAKDAQQRWSATVVRNYTFNIPPPVVTATPASSNHAGGSVLVSLQATSPRIPVTIYYTTDNTIPTQSSAVYTAPITLSGGDPDTLQFFGVDAEGRVSEIQKTIYTYYPIPDITVYFKRPANWSTNVRIHYFNTQPAGVLAPTSWPGLPMEKVCGDWYKFTVSGVTSLGIVFNDGAGKQTADLATTTTRYYDNGWLNNTPNITAPIAAFEAQPGLTGAAPFTVTFNGSLSTACNGVQSLNWNFGNGQTGSGPQPVTTYSNPGSYTVTLTVTDNSGEQVSTSQTITVTAAPTGFWVYFKKPDDWAAPIRLRYYNRLPGNSGIAAPGEAMVQHCGPWYKYYFANTAATNLVIADNTNKATTDLHANQHTTFIGNRKVLGAPDMEQLLFANFEITPPTGVAPLSTGFSTEAVVDCQQILQYQWNFGNGNTATGPAPAQVYNQAGIYQVNLAVTNQNGAVHNITKKLVVGQAGETLKIHFRRPLGWNNIPHLYVWNPQPAASTPAWPGTPMTEEGNGWWVLTVAGVQCANVIMNNGGQPQTADLTNICGEQWYDGLFLNPLTGGGSLPLSWLQLEATRQGKEALLNWRIASHFTVAAFMVERSLNGQQFETIGQVIPNGQPGAAYAFADSKLPPAPVVYYRIQVKAANGTALFSPVRTIGLSATNGFAVTPNPAKSQFVLSFGRTLATAAMVRLLNNHGQVINTIPIAAGAQATTITRKAAWLPGLYWLEVVDAQANRLFQHKIMLE